MAAFVLVGSVVSSAQAAAAGATSFSGTTSQRMAITFELSAGWRSIGRFRVTYRAECGGEAARGIGKRLTFRGKVVGRRVVGTVRVDNQYGGLFHCWTRALRWTAIA